MFEAERSVIGTKLINAGSIVEDAAHEHSKRFDPNMKATGGVAEAAAQLMISLGEKIMPPSPESDK
jgi:hypothetical protein